MEEAFNNYYQTIQKQVFDESLLDYSIFENQIPFLNQMATIKNSGLSVFDFHKKEHIYNSYNFKDLFGYDLNKIENEGTEYYNSRIHPDDMLTLLQNGTSLLNYYYTLPEIERKDYKLQNDYRILNGNNEYIRIIEQHLVLELDAKGNIWLALSVIDVSPNQTYSNGVISQLVNVKTGQTENVNEVSTNKILLSKREEEILSFVKKGFLSKEISDNLSISIHTVNTHRQNILKKLNANNSFEAIEYAIKHNLA